MSPLRPERKKRKRSNEERIPDSGLGAWGLARGQRPGQPLTSNLQPLRDRYLRSSVKLTFSMRGFVIKVGADQTLLERLNVPFAPAATAYAAFAVRIVLRFNALNRSRF